MVIGQPTTADKWARLEPTKGAALATGDVQVHPGELLATMEDNRINLIILDVRDEADYNLFHIHGSSHVPMEKVPSVIPELLLEASANTVYVLVSNDGVAATQAWKELVAESVPNAYILDGGVNHWLSIFAAEDPEITPRSLPLRDLRPTPAPSGGEHLTYAFSAALGERYTAAKPESKDFKLEYTPKIKLQTKRGPSGGGCG
jgi:hypothetical protein